MNVDGEDDVKLTETEIEESASDLGIGDDDDDPNAEPEVEGEGEGEGKAEDEEAGAEPEQDERAKPPKSIPYDRFREVNEAKKAAQERAQQLEQELARVAPLAQRAAELEAVNAARPENDAALAKAVMDAQKKLRNALFDDDEASVDQAEAELLAAQDARADARAAAREAAREQQARQRSEQSAQERADAAYAVALQDVIKRFPAISGDAELEAMVVAARDLRVQQGAAGAQALVEAAESVAKRLNLQTAAAPAAAAKSRRDRSLERHLDAAERQPSRTGPAGDGVRQRATAGHNLSRDEYDRLSDADRAVELGIA